MDTLTTSHSSDRMANVIRILQEMRELILPDISDDFLHEEEMEDEMEVCESTTDQPNDPIDEPVQDPQPCHPLSMPDIFAFVPSQSVTETATTTIPVVPREDEIHVPDYERLKERLRACREKFEQITGSRGQYVKARPQTVRPFDDRMLHLLENANRGFKFKINQVLQTKYNCKLAPEAFIPEELLTGLVVEIKEPEKDPETTKTSKKSTSKKTKSRSDQSNRKKQDPVDSNSDQPATRFSLTHSKSQVLRIDHPIEQSISVYNDVMKPAIDRVDEVEEVIRLRKELREKEKSLKLALTKWRPVPGSRTSRRRRPSSLPDSESGYSSMRSCDTPLSTISSIGSPFFSPASPSCVSSIPSSSSHPPS